MSPQRIWRHVVFLARGRSRGVDSCFRSQVGFFVHELRFCRKRTESAEERHRAKTLKETSHRRTKKLNRLVKELSLFTPFSACLVLDVDGRQHVYGTFTELAWRELRQVTFVPCGRCNDHCNRASHLTPVVSISVGWNCERGSFGRELNRVKYCRSMPRINPRLPDTFNVLSPRLISRA